MSVASIRFLLFHKNKFAAPNETTFIASAADKKCDSHYCCRNFLLSTADRFLLSKMGAWRIMFATPGLRPTQRVCGGYLFINGL